MTSKLFKRTTKRHWVRTGTEADGVIEVVLTTDTFVDRGYTFAFSAQEAENLADDLLAAVDFLEKDQFFLKRWFQVRGE